jgi:two-component system chemotaxis response regulator CheY
MGMKILVVDDSRIIRCVVAKTLSLCHLSIDTIFEAGNGVEALTQLGNEHIDLVFTDINMPEMDGVELVTKMKSNPAYAKIPVVVISTEGSEPRINALMLAGIQDFIRKPFTPEQLRGVIVKHVGGGDHAVISE